MLTDSDSALKRKCDDSGTIYVLNAENLDISHATVMSATLSTHKIIGIDTVTKHPKVRVICRVR